MKKIKINNENNFVYKVYTHMDVLVVALWLLSIVILHLLLRRVVEIEYMNRTLLKELNQEKDLQKKNVVKEISDEDLQKELLDYVTAQDYKLPEEPKFEIPPMIMTNFADNNSQPSNSTNIVQQFNEERDINSGTFGELQAFEENDFATIN